MTTRNSSHKTLTLKDVAKATGFSPSTVSAAFSTRPDPRYREETLVRVRAAAEKLGFRVNRQARLLRGGKSQTILLLKNVTLQQVIAEMTIEVQAALNHEDYQLITSDLVMNMHLEQIYDTVADFKIDGIILGSVPRADTLLPVIERCRAKGVKVVSIEGQQMDDARVFTGDYYQGFSAVFEHLIAAGAQEIALGVLGFDLDNPFQWRTQQALAAFNDVVMQRPGVRGEVVAKPTVEFYRSLERIYFEPGRFIMGELLKRKKRPDAVVFLNDLFAIGALRLCQEQGIDVPGEIMISGCDQTAVAQNLTPTLTTLKLPIEAICQQAVRALINDIEGKENDTPPSGIVALPLELIPGESTKQKASALAES